MLPEYKGEIGQTYGHTFHFVKDAGFLGLGARIQVIENGEVVDEATVYGDTLHAIRRHMDAEVDEAIIRELASPREIEAAIQKILETNSLLPERFQRAHPAVVIFEQISQTPSGA